MSSVQKKPLSVMTRGLLGVCDYPEPFHNTAPRIPFVATSTCIHTDKQNYKDYVVQKGDKDGMWSYWEDAKGTEEKRRKGRVDNKEPVLIRSSSWGNQA